MSFADTDEAPILRGWAEKQGGSHKSWKKRYFQTSQRFPFRLDYFTNDKCTTMKGYIDLTGVSDMVVTKNIDTKTNKMRYGFQLVTEKRTWKIIVEGEEEAEQWKENFRKLINQVRKSKGLPPLPSGKHHHHHHHHHHHDKDKKSAPKEAPKEAPKPKEDAAAAQITAAAPPPPPSRISATAAPPPPPSRISVTAAPPPPPSRATTTAATLPPTGIRTTATAVPQFNTQPQASPRLSGVAPPPPTGIRTAATAVPQLKPESSTTSLSSQFEMETPRSNSGDENEDYFPENEEGAYEGEAEGEVEGGVEGEAEGEYDEEGEYDDEDYEEEAEEVKPEEMTDLDIRELAEGEKYAVALHDYEGGSETELTIARGQKLIIFDDSDPDGWLGAEKKDGTRGWVSAHYVQFI